MPASRERREADVQAPALTRRYGDALRVADTSAAEHVVDEALEAGLTPSAIQSLIIEPAMTRIGELWEANAITVADEHLATAVSQAVLVKLFDKLTVARARSRERILLAAAEGQQHVLGLRMIADVLRRAFDDRMHAQVCADSSVAGALLMIDVDAFKAVNDTHGHAAGDRLLRLIGAAITGATRSHDFAARIGGDEFAVLLPRAGREQARRAALRIRGVIADDGDLPVTVTIGMATLSSEIRAIVLAADVALYAAKAAGRDCVFDADGHVDPLQTPARP